MPSPRRFITIYSGDEGGFFKRLERGKRQVRTESTSDIVFARQFWGDGTWGGPGRGVLTTVSTASKEVALRPDRRLLWGQSESLGVVTLRTEIALTGSATFQAVGALELAPSDVIRISTIGSGHLLPELDGRRAGAALWRVDHACGRFRDVTGLIASLISIADLDAGVEQQVWLIAIK